MTKTLPAWEMKCYSILWKKFKDKQFTNLEAQKELKLDERGAVSRVTDGAIMRNLIHSNQDVPVSYYINSALYAFKRSTLFDGNNSLWGNSTYGYVMDEKYALDIDTPQDWMVAEVKMKHLLEKK